VVYDSVEEILGFYAHFKEQTAEEITKRIRVVGPRVRTSDNFEVYLNLSSKTR
jgi:hypothetical protein